MYTREDLQNKTKNGLNEVARIYRIPYYSRMRKEDLIEVLLEAQEEATKDPESYNEATDSETTELGSIEATPITESTETAPTVETTEAAPTVETTEAAPPKQEESEQGNEKSKKRKRISTQNKVFSTTKPDLGLIAQVEEPPSKQKKSDKTRELIEKDFQTMSKFEEEERKRKQSIELKESPSAENETKDLNDTNISDTKQIEEKNDLNDKKTTQEEINVSDEVVAEDEKEIKEKTFAPKEKNCYRNGAPQYSFDGLIFNEGVLEILQEGVG